MLLIKLGFIIKFHSDKIVFVRIHSLLNVLADFSLQSSVSAFFPKIFDKDSVYPNLKSQLIAFRALFAFVLLFRILKVIFVDLYKLVKTFIQTHKLNLPLSLIFNMGILIVLTIVLVVSITNNFNMA